MICTSKLNKSAFLQKAFDQAVIIINKTKRSFIEDINRSRQLNELLIAHLKEQGFLPAELLGELDLEVSVDSAAAAESNKKSEASSSNVSASTSASTSSTLAGGDPIVGAGSSLSARQIAVIEKRLKKKTTKMNGQAPVASTSGRSSAPAPKAGVSGGASSSAQLLASDEVTNPRNPYYEVYKNPNKMSLEVMQQACKHFHHQLETVFEKIDPQTAKKKKKEKPTKKEGSSQDDVPGCGVEKKQVNKPRV